MKQVDIDPKTIDLEECHCMREESHKAAVQELWQDNSCQRNMKRENDMKNREMLMELKKAEPMFDKLSNVAYEIVKNVFDDYCTSIDDIIVGDKTVEIVYEYGCRREYGHESEFVPIEWFDEGFDYEAAYREMKRKAREAEQRRKAAAKKAAAARKAKKEYETYLKLKQKYEAGSGAK